MTARYLSTCVPDRGLVAGGAEPLGAGEQRIVIPTGTVIVSYLPGSIGELRAGAVIFFPAANRMADGTLQTQRVMVGREIAPQ